MSKMLQLLISSLGNWKQMKKNTTQNLTPSLPSVYLPVWLAEMQSFGKIKKYSTSSSSDLSANENLSTWFKHRCHCSSPSHGDSYLKLEWEKQEEAGQHKCTSEGTCDLVHRTAKACYSLSASVSPPARSDPEYSDTI